MKYIRVYILLLISCLLMPLAAAQVGRAYPTFRDLTPQEQQHYKQRPAEILPDAETAFDKGNYARTLMLCSMHESYFGDETRRLSERTQLDAKAKKCYDLMQEMNESYAEGRFAEAKLKARTLLYINGQDPAALQVWNSTIAVTGVALSPDTLSVQVGKTAQLSAQVSPAEASNKAVVWITADNLIATVDQNGLVKAVRPGRVEISVLTKDGGFSGICTVTVLAAPEPQQQQPEDPWNALLKPGPVKVTSIAITQDTLTLEAGKSRLLSAKVYPDNAADKRFTWYSGDISVVTVLDNGYVTAVGPGATMVTAMTVDGNWKDSCRVVVPAPEAPVAKVAQVTPAAPAKPAEKPVEKAVAAPKVVERPHTSFVAKAGVGTTTNWGFFPELAVGVYNVGGSRFGAEIGGYLYKASTLYGLDASASFRIVKMLYLRAGAGFFSYNQDASNTMGMNANAGLNILIKGHFCIDIGLRYYPKIQVMGTETVTTSGVPYSIPVPETVLKAGVAPSIKIGYAF